MSGQPFEDPAQEGFVLELFEELLGVEPERREDELEARLAGRPDAQRITARIERLLGIERGMGALSPGGSLGSVLAAGAESPEPQPPVELELGTVVAGFELLERVGRGGMGVVYRARQQKPERDVALKILAGDGELIEFRLQHEGNLLAYLNHPAIARVYLLGVATDERSGRRLPWMAMEFVEGARDICTALGGASREAVIATFIEVLEGVHHGHQKGVVHRDLKPDNLLVDKHGRPRVIDFGVASLCEDSGPVSQLLGTLAYMAPELLEPREGPLGADVRWDVYSLGVVLFELLLKRPARESEGQELGEFLAKLRDEPLVVPAGSGLPRSLEWILGMALAREPELRYASVDAFRRDLVSVGRHLPVEARSLAPARARRVHTAGLFLRRSWALLLVLAGVIGSLGMALHAAESEAREHARAERMQAVAFGVSLDLITDFAERVARLPGGLETRQEMIEAGLVVLGELADQPDSLGPEARFDLATADVALGDVLGYTRGPNLGRFDAAKDAYDQAQELLDGLPVAFAGSLGPRRLTAKLIERNAILRRTVGDLEGAHAGLVEWGATLESLLPLAEDVEGGRVAAEITVDLGQSFEQRARIVGFWRRNDEAFELFESAVQIYRGLESAPPPEFDLLPVKFHLQQALGMCAVASAQLGDTPGSMAFFVERNERLAWLLEQQPSNAIFLRSRAEGVAIELEIRRHAGAFEGGPEVFEAGLAALDALGELDPTDVKNKASTASLVALAGEFEEAWAAALSGSPEAGAVESHRLQAVVHFEDALERFDALKQMGGLTGLGRMQADKARESLVELE